MPTPRYTFGATSITRPSSILADPASIFGGFDHDPADCLAAMSAALEMLLAARPAWHDAASCRNHPTVDFHSRNTTMRSAAFTICAGCPVRDDCLAWAIEIEDWTPAILGGCDGPARRRLARNPTPSRPT